MTSDKCDSREKKIRRIIRMASGESPDHIAENPEPDHQMTPSEIAAAQALLKAEPLPKYIDLSKLNMIAIDHPVQEVGKAVLMQAMGINDETFFEGSIRHLINAVSATGKGDMRELNHAISLVASIEPRDQLETMLAIQMAAVHISAMGEVRRLKTADTIERLDIHERTANKLMRTFTSQMEALRKHRNGGNQNVIVKHVHVHEGGQAIVGNVSHGGRGKNRKGMQPHEQSDLSIPVGAAVLGHVEEDEMSMSGTSREGKERLPVSRGTIGRSKGKTERGI